MSKRNRIVAALAAAVAVVVLLARLGPWGRGPAMVPELVELAPADATLVVYADLAALRDSSVFQRLAAAAPAAPLDPGYAAFIEATGFDYRRDLDRVVLAGRGEGTDRRTLAVAEGRFDRVAIERYAEQAGRPAPAEGRPVYIVPSAEPGKDISVAFLGDDRIALSDGAALPADAGQGTLGTALRQRVSRVSGSPLFAVFHVAGEGSMPGRETIGSSPLLDSLEWVSLAVRPDGGDVILSAEAECRTPEHAQQLASMLELMRGVIGRGLADPEAGGRMPAEAAAMAGRVLGSVRISAEASRVRLLLVVTPEMIEAAAPEAGR